MTATALTRRPWLWPLLAFATCVLLLCAGTERLLHRNDPRQMLTTLAWCTGYSFPVWVALLAIVSPAGWGSNQPAIFGWLFLVCFSLFIAVGLRRSVPNYSFLPAPAASAEFLLNVPLELGFATILSSPVWIPVIGTIFSLSRSRYGLLVLLLLFAVEGVGLVLSRFCFTILQVLSF